ncbi:MAG: hypothetical protein M1830_000919 [Pleopsidium flavum]|nr:MAG: hypothetical protein M1830_000919 [Pleopsidium flavum]
MRTISSILQIDSPRRHLPGVRRHQGYGISPFPYECGPNAKFWRPYINGTSFPDCHAVEINHYWSSPPCDPVLLITIARHAHQRRSYSGLGIDRARTELGILTGLKRLESLSLEYVIELDDDILQNIFRSRMAESLKILELRYCNIDYVVLAELMEGALPVLTHFTFLDRMDSILAESSRYALAQHDTSTAHLCPRIREFGKNLNHLVFAVPFICRDMFLSRHDVEALNRSGITTDVGTPDGRILAGMSLDRHAIQQVLAEHRHNQSHLHKKAYTATAVAEVKASSSVREIGSVFGGRSTQGGELKVVRDAEYSYEQEELKRARTISEAKGGWMRKIIAWEGMCRDDETWAEMMVEADLEEAGVEWVLANLPMAVASKHRSGLSKDVDIADIVGRESDNDRYDW